MTDFFRSLKDRINRLRGGNNGSNPSLNILPPEIRQMVEQFGGQGRNVQVIDMSTLFNRGGDTSDDLDNIFGTGSHSDEGYDGNNVCLGSGEAHRGAVTAETLRQLGASEGEISMMLKRRGQKQRFNWREVMKQVAADPDQETTPEVNDSVGVRGILGATLFEKIVVVAEATGNPVELELINELGRLSQGVAGATDTLIKADERAKLNGKALVAAGEEVDELRKRIDRLSRSVTGSYGLWFRFDKITAAIRRILDLDDSLDNLLPQEMSEIETGVEAVRTEIGRVVEFEALCGEAEVANQTVTFGEMANALTRVRTETDKPVREIFVECFPSAGLSLEAGEDDDFEDEDQGNESLDPARFDIEELDEVVGDELATLTLLAVPEGETTEQVVIELPEQPVVEASATESVADEVL